MGIYKPKDIGTRPHQWFHGGISNFDYHDSTGYTLIYNIKKLCNRFFFHSGTKPPYWDVITSL